MRVRFSILNLLLVTTILALVIVIIRLRSEFAQEHSLRVQQLRHGGILQVGDPNAVHLVQVSTRGELNTHRWRVYVPKGRSVILSSRLEPVPADKPIAPRLPPNTIVVADRNPSNPVKLDPGENVVTIHCTSEQNPGLEVDVVGDRPRLGELLRPADGTLEWLKHGYQQDLTDIEHSTKIFNALAAGQTVKAEDGKTFVLLRYRAFVPDPDPKNKSKVKVGEILIWIQPDGN